MSAADVTVFAGRSRADGLSDLATSAEVANAVGRTDGLLIIDPLAFPWDSLGSYPDIPLVIDLSETSADDRKALAPVLDVLTVGDALLGERDSIDTLCDELGLPSLWAPDDLVVGEHVHAARGTKRCSIEERRILDRLGTDPALTILLLGVDELRGASGGLVEIVRRHVEEAGLEGVVVDTIWGIRIGPGEPLQRAVVALRSTNTPGQAP